MIHGAAAWETLHFVTGHALPLNVEEINDKLEQLQRNFQTLDTKGESWLDERSQLESVFTVLQDKLKKCELFQGDKCPEAHKVADLIDNIDLLRTQSTRSLADLQELVGTVFRNPVSRRGGPRDGRRETGQGVAASSGWNHRVASLVRTVLLHP